MADKTPTQDDIQFLLGKISGVALILSSVIDTLSQKQQSSVRGMIDAYINAIKRAKNDPASPHDIRFQDGRLSTLELIQMLLKLSEKDT